MKYIVFIHMAVDTYSGKSCQGETFLGNNVTHMNEIITPKDGEYVLQNMFSEI